MSTPPRRDNGHVAASYAPLVDLDPHVADAVLELLGEHGIAAYVSPATRSNPAGQFVLPPMNRVLDRVHVDSARRGQARDLIDAHLATLQAETPPPEPAPDDDDAWAAIVAAWDAPPATDAHRGRPPGTGDTAGVPAGIAPPTDGWASYVDLPSAPEPPSADSDSDPDHHFVPPTPPPLPSGDPVTRWAWVGLVGGPLLLVLSAVLRIDLGEWMLLLGVLGFVGGFVTLVARMEDRPPNDSGPDDGAVV